GRWIDDAHQQAQRAGVRGAGQAGTNRLLRAVQHQLQRWLRAVVEQRMADVRAGATELPHVDAIGHAQGLVDNQQVERLGGATGQQCQFIEGADWCDAVVIEAIEQLFDMQQLLVALIGNQDAQGFVGHAR
ncbi:hypothetical protein CN998_33245, partial [Bacillus cereus]